MPGAGGFSYSKNLCVLFNREHILSYENLNENALIRKRSICMAFIYTKDVSGIKIIMSLVKRKL